MVSESDMVTTLLELNEDYIGRHVYLLMVNDEIYATTLKKEMDEFLNSEDSPIDPWTVDSGGLIYGIVLNPEALPYEISEDVKDGRTFYLLRSEDSGSYGIVIETHDTLDDLTFFVEAAIEVDENLDINEDFAVLLANDIEFTLALKTSGIPVKMRVRNGE